MSTGSARPLGCPRVLVSCWLSAVLLLAWARQSTAQAVDCGCSTQVACGTPGPEGCWEGPWDWSCQIADSGALDYLEFSHAALIPKGYFAGSVLLFRLEDGGTDTTAAWIFDPSSPLALKMVQAKLSSTIFCADQSWDDLGNLVVAGGNTAQSPPAESYHFFPTGLTVQVMVPAPGCPFPSYPAIGGQVWKSAGNMSIGRYYPTLITLLKGDIFADTPPNIRGASSFVVGGDPTDPFPSGLVGNDWWQVHEPLATSWGHTLYSDDPNLPTAPAPSEEYDREGTPLPEAVIEYYPRMVQLATTGPFDDHVKNVFIANDVEAVSGGPSANGPGDSWVIKPRYATTQAEWELWRGPQGGPTGSPVERFYGSAVLLHSLGNNGLNRVLLFGGRYGDELRSEVEELTIPSGTDPKNASWTVKANGMATGRYYHNAVVLPTGQVFLVGGACDIDDLTGRPTPSHCPELFDPGTAGLPANNPSVKMTARPNAPGVLMPYPRLYHHVGVLLPDGRVFIAGGIRYTVGGYANGKYSGEVFSPPYLGYGSRPDILSAPDVVDFDDGTNAFTVKLDVDALNPIDAFVLLRPAAVTHHFDGDQRYIELEFVEGENPGDYTVTPPADDLGPPGYYMLFAIRDVQGQGRNPSVGHFLRLQ